MKKIILLILLIGFSILLNAQKNHKFMHVDRVMEQISDSSTYSNQGIADYINTEFFTQEEKARAIFFWITGSIYYDYNNVYSDSNLNSDEILKIRKGVCRDFTKLYLDIAVRVGIKTHVIIGYTRKKKRVNYNPHAWCASMIDSTWYLIDPTWGAGYVRNNHYIKEINNDYFMVRPDRFIKTHIPFDPLWQFLNYPITKEEFKKGKSKSKNREVYFNFIDTLKAYDNKSEVESLLNSVARIKSNNISSYLDYYNLKKIEKEIKRIYERIAEDKYIKALKIFHEAIVLSNEYVDYQNKYYLPYKSDAEVEKMLDNIENKLNSSLSQLKLINRSSPYLKVNTDHLYYSINTMISNLNDTRMELEKYLNIAKEYRKSLSYNKELELNNE